jgi:deazaflavin-dependent oxidoreductase (nitroreductase family)
MTRFSSPLPAESAPAPGAGQGTADWHLSGVQGRYLELVRRIGGTRWFAWLGIHLLTRLDKWLFPRFHGRLVSAGPPILPLVQLTTIGRLSGRPRSTPLVYLTDGEDLVVVGSNWGQAHHPAWTSNLLAQPRAIIEINGHQCAVMARLATPAEKARLWPRLLALYPPYQTYADRSGRDLRLFIFTPISA